MSEINTAALETTVVEDVESDQLDQLTLSEIVAEIVTETFGTDETVTAYKVATSINKVFEATMTEKRIPTQMAYNYTRNGMIAKGKKGKASDIRYTKDEVLAFVNKYTAKHVDL